MYIIYTHHQKKIVLIFCCISDLKYQGDYMYTYSYLYLYRYVYICVIHTYICIYALGVPC